MTAGTPEVDLQQLPSRLHELDRAGLVYVVCASGNRSAAMTGFLTAAGFTAYSVRGGTGAWARAGRAVVTGLRPTV